MSRPYIIIVVVTMLCIAAALVANFFLVRYRKGKQCAREAEIIKVLEVLNQFPPGEAMELSRLMEATGLDEDSILEVRQSRDGQWALLTWERKTFLFTEYSITDAGRAYLHDRHKS